MINSISYSFSNNFLYVLSIPNAPSGAVIIIASTATDKIILPQASPAARGTEPIAAWTVAFGRYAITQNILSFILSLVFIVHIKTPAVLKINAIKIITIPIIICNGNPVDCCCESLE